MSIETKNAIIERAYFDTERGLSAWLTLDYGDCGHQSFGGYCLYVKKLFREQESKGNYAGHFIYRCLQIGDVSDWAKLVGRTIRVRADHGKVYAIGHIVKDDWFNPSEDFKEQP